MADQIVVFPRLANSDLSRLVGRLAEVRIAQVTPNTLIGQVEKIEGL